MKYILVLSFSVLANLSLAQRDGFWNNFSFNAQAGVYGDFYNLKSFGEDIPGRRPDKLLRFMASGSVGFKGFNIPFNVMLTNNQQNVNVPLPVPTDQNIIDFITNPINSVGFAPELPSSGKITLGTYVPKYGIYTSGVLRVFGLGADFTFNDKWRVALHTGNSQIAVPESVFDSRSGSYTRRVLAGKVGYGNDKDTHLHLVFFRANDRLKSQPNVLSLVPPQQNSVLGLNYRWKINDHYFVEGEVARSAITENTLEPSVVAANKVFRDLININATSRLGAAYKLIAGKQGKWFSVKVVAEYINEGFSSLAFPFLQPDQLNLTIEPTAKLMNGKVILTGAIGRRANNVSGEKGATAYQNLYLLNASWQATQQLNIATSVSNFGFRNTVRNDTLKIENVTRSISISPSYTISSASKMHSITLNLATESFRDFNTFTGAESDNDAITILGTYVLGFLSKPLSLNFMAMQFTNDMLSMKLSMSTLSAGADYSLLQKKARAGLKLVYSSNSTNEADPANQLLTQLSYTHQLLKKLTFSFNGSINLYRFGEEKPDVRYRETLLRTSLIYQFK